MTFYNTNFFISESPKVAPEITSPEKKPTISPNFSTADKQLEVWKDDWRHSDDDSPRTYIKVFEVECYTRN